MQYPLKRTKIPLLRKRYLPEISANLKLTYKTLVFLLPTGKP